LVAATRPPLGRVVLLSKFEETLIIDGEKFELSANQYPNKIYPEGFKYLKNFRLEPFPIWTFEAGGIEIEKKVFMVYGENTVACQWKIIKPKKQKNAKKESEKQIKLELKPLIAFHDYHYLLQNTEAFNPEFR